MLVKGSPGIHLNGNPLDIYILENYIFNWTQTQEWITFSWGQWVNMLSPALGYIIDIMLNIHDLLNIHVFMYALHPLYVSRGHLKNACELLNLRALKISMLYKNHTFQCMGKIFCVEFQMVPLKFHTKYLTQTLKDVDFIHRWKFKSS